MVGHRCITVCCEDVVFGARRTAALRAASGRDALLVKRTRQPGPHRSARPGRLLLLAFALLSASTPLAAMVLSVRDAETGAFVDAEATLTSSERAPQSVGVSGGRAALDASTDIDLELRAPAHQSLLTHLAAGTSALQVWLDPREQRVPAPVSGRDRAVLEGHVYDPARARAVSGARVQLGKQIAHTDALGYFQLEVTDIAAEAGNSAALRVSAVALPDWTQRLRLTPTSTHLIIDMGSGRPGSDHHFDSPVPMSDAAPAPNPIRAPILTPPTSIRVGYADAGFTTPCCVGACAAVSVMSLETYVKRGLNDEWIASWTADSLRAGAIAYRSYGAWHVANPRSVNYDICSSACCQVNDPDTSTSSSSAVDATAGILLTRDNAIFRAEYSAENNSWDDPNDGLDCANADLSCGNGFVGSPAAGWPCLADSVAAGHGCFGHGRGMSQWGSQRWALDQARRWPWIVDHYYNDNGTGAGLRTAQLTSPLRIDTLTSPASAAPGQSITLTLDISNLATLPHNPVWIGASLYSVATGFVSDPPRDQPVSLNPGAQQRTRDFLLAANLPAGSYDVIVALYLDIDANGAINSGDLALTSTRQNAVLSLTAAPLFSNGFE